MVTKRATTKKKRATPARREPKKRASLDPTLFSDIIAIGNKIPDEDLAKLPSDGAARHDDYLEEMLR